MPADSVTKQPITYSAASLSNLQQRVVSSHVAVAFGSGSGKGYDVEDVDRADFLDGRDILVLGRLPSRLFTIDMGTGQLRNVARQGSGPGELQQLSDFMVLGDTIVISDWAALRVTALRRPSGYLWARRIESPATRATRRIAGVLSSGEIVMYSAGGFGPEGDTSTRTISDMVSLPRSGPTRLVLRRPDLRLVRTETRYRGRVRYRAVPLGLSSSVSAVATGSTIISTSAEHYELDFRSLDGRSQQTVRFLKPRRAVRRAIRQAAIAEELERRVFAPRGEPLIDRAETERLVRTAVYADSLPAIHSLLLGRDGTTWVVDGIGPSDLGWSATGIRADGSLVARLTSNTPGRPLAIERDRVLVRELDVDGAAVLRVRVVSRRSPD